MKLTINDLELTPRVGGLLQRAGITEVAQLTDLSYEDLRYHHGFGKKTIADIENALDIEGLHLKR